MDSESQAANPNDDPIAELRRLDEPLDDELEQRIHELGEAAVPDLIALLLSPEAHQGDAWPAHHAAMFLRELQAKEAIEPFCAVVASDFADEDVFNDVLDGLAEFGADALEPLLALHAREEEPLVKDLVLEPLSRLGVQDARVYAILLECFQRDPNFGSDLLASYGDPRALPIVHAAISGYQPDFGDLESRQVFRSLLLTHRKLSGTLEPELQARNQSWLERWHEHEHHGRPVVKAAKVGRNDACPCGSGKKHKKCCGAS